MDHFDLTKFKPAHVTADEDAAYQIAGNIFVKLMTLDAPGKRIQGHSHPYDHVSLLAFGSVVMRSDGNEVTYTGPQLFITPAGIEHEFECVEPAYICCIHAIRNGDLEQEVSSFDITPSQALALLAQYPLAHVNASDEITTASNGK